MLHSWLMLLVQQEAVLTILLVSLSSHLPASLTVIMSLRVCFGNKDSPVAIQLSSPSVYVNPLEACMLPTS